MNRFGELYESMCKHSSNTFKNIEEIEGFLVKHNLPKLIQEKEENLNRSIPIEEIRRVI